MNGVQAEPPPERCEQGAQYLRAARPHEQAAIDFMRAAGIAWV
jgi:hypothetical protein